MFANLAHLERKEVAELIFVYSNQRRYGRERVFQSTGPVSEPLEARADDRDAQLAYVAAQFSAVREDADRVTAALQAPGGVCSVKIKTKIKKSIFEN